MSSLSSRECADEGLELVRAFVNTLEIDGPQRSEELADAAALTAWIRERAGLAVSELGPREHRCAIALRESLRALLLSHNGVEIDPAELTPLRRAAAEARLAVRFEGDRRVAVAPAGEGLAAFEEKLLLAIAEAQALGTWERLKACRAEDCHWAFYDSSRNRSGAWCSMEVCGNRAKTRRYRRRRARA